MRQNLMRQNLMMARLLFGSLAALGLVVALVGWVAAEDDAPRVRVQVDGRWYTCQADDPATPHPIFRTATAWQMPPTPTPEVWRAYVVRVPRLNLRHTPTLAPESYVTSVAQGEVLVLTNATRTGAGYVWRQRADGLWLAAQRLSDGARFIVPQQDISNPYAGGIPDVIR